MAAAPGPTPRVAIVGASSLLGKDLKQVLEDRNFPAREFILLDEAVVAGTLTEAGGEPTFIRPLEEDSFEGTDIVFFAGSALDAARNWPVARRAGATVIDLTGAASIDEHSVRLIPALRPVFPPLAAKGANGSGGAIIYLAPSAPVLIAAALAAALNAFKPLRIALTLFAPVSERNEAGIEELESQTAALLSFREISKTVFDAQVAFNLLPAYGEESKPRLADLRKEISGETAAFLAGRAASLAIQLIHAPVFYGYAFSAYAEFASPVQPQELAASFAQVCVKVAAVDDPPPSNASVAGEGEIQLAPIDTDPNAPNGIWLWGAADNLRLPATNAARIAEDLIRGA